MAEYQQLTPAQRARGRYTVREPFVINTEKDYTCIGIRGFNDLYREKIDPYEAVYKPVGLIDNSTTADGTIFKYSEEAARGINIITLADDVGNHILVPDNYITSMPVSSSVSYLEFVLSVSLGPLPSDMDTIVAEQAVKDAVAEQFGVDPTVKTHTLPTTTNPTYEEHLALEQARQGKVIVGSSKDALIKQLQNSNNEKDLKIASLVKIMQDHNILPT